jgi:hypothetical protein
MVRRVYSEGDWFAVPLRPAGYATGIVARASRGGVLLGYFFGPYHSNAPSLADTAGSVPEHAILTGMFGHLGLQEGSWSLLGRDPNWDRARWPMPVFVRYEELTGRSFYVHYDDADPSHLIHEDPAPPGHARQLPNDGLMGAGFVEERLTGLLTS